ncbi:MAG TPA: DUF4350 domain-containing protein [Acidimicrobiia bacterium]|nr:DUF4350 domain-containing protein [Acidimicrobiia bacterium]
MTPDRNDGPGVPPPPSTTAPGRSAEPALRAAAARGKSEGAGPPEARTPNRAGRFAAAAGAALLALAALSSFLPGGGGQGGGSPSSSYSNRPDGTSAWAELLSRYGCRVDRLRGDLESAALDTTDTVVVLDAPGLSTAEAEALGRFVHLGGRLVAGGAGADGWLRAVLDHPPAITDEGPKTVRPAGDPPAPEAAGVARIRTAGAGSFDGALGDLHPVLEGDGDVVAAAGPSERGRVVILADPSPVQNGLLATDDNAALAVALVGGPGHTVYFAEGPHGYGAGEGLAALPRRWRLTLAGVGLAAAVWVLARSRRLGPPEDDARPLPPPRWAYVEAVAGTLQRTRRPGEAVEPVRRRARDLVAARTGLSPDAGTQELIRAARQLGLPDDEAGAAVGPGPFDEAAALAAGRALARLSAGAGHDGGPR